MRSVLTISALLACSAMASAQQPAPVAPQPAQLQQQPATDAMAACPVAVSARRAPAGALEETGGTRFPAEPVPLAVLLKLDGDVTLVRATLYGPSQKPRAVPVELLGQDAVDHFTLRAPMREPDGSFLLETTRLGSVQRIEITEIRFRNGDRWRADMWQSCVLVPNGVMPVAKAAVPHGETR